MRGGGPGIHGRVSTDPGHVHRSAAAAALTEGEVVEAVVVEDVVDQLVRDAVERLGPTRTDGEGTRTADNEQAERARDAVLELFARADVWPELPTLIAGIGNLYEHGYDVAADHMEMARWGLRHQLMPAITAAPRPA